MSVELYPHNQVTYNRMMKMFESSNRVAIIQPTGTGKSFLFLRWIEEHPNNRIVILSPSTEIFTQFQEYSYASELEISDNVQMITYQALLHMSEYEIEDIKVDNIILDEFHRIGAELWGPAVQALLDNNPSAKILGATATPIRYLDEGKNMAALLFDNNLAQNMTLGDAVRRGILPAPRYIPASYNVDQKLNTYQNDIHNVRNKTTRKELIQQLERIRRTLENSYGAEMIFKKYMPNNHGKYIVFCRNTEHLAEMLRTVPEWLRRVNSKVRCYISISAELDKDKQLQTFKQDNGSDTIKLLFTIDRLNEGLHIKGIDGVIMLRPTTSPIIYLQQMGRALAAGKKSPLIFDFVNNYQSVRVPLSDGTSKNVFEQEYSHCLGADTDEQTFHIFSKAIEFTSLFEELEYTLYPSNDQLWHTFYKKYKKFKQTFTRDPVTGEVFEGLNLGTWAAVQRIRYKKGKLSKEREHLLLDAGFNLYSKNISWNKSFAIYLQFKEVYHFEPKSGVVFNGFHLGAWVNNQRMAYTKGALSKERIQLLLDAGFVFDTLHEQSWNDSFSQYQQYKKIFHREPKGREVFNGYFLGPWVSNQRTAYNNGKLSKERIQLLLDAGFVFDYREQIWKNGFDKYQQFKRLYHREPKQREQFNGFNLGNWANAQKYAYRNNTLSKEHFQLLSEAGFVFSAHGQAWDNAFCLYQNFKSIHNREPAQGEVFRGFGLGSWAISQRERYKKGKLPENRIHKLLEAGFPLVNTFHS